MEKPQVDPEYIDLIEDDAENEALADVLRIYEGTRILGGTMRSQYF
jgi:hypothetical protein